MDAYFECVCVTVSLCKILITFHTFPWATGLVATVCFKVICFLESFLTLITLVSSSSAGNPVFTVNSRVSGLLVIDDITLYVKIILMVCLRIQGIVVVKSLY